MAERGQMDGLTLGLLLRIAAALEIQLDLRPRWRGGDLDRLLDAKHAALGERVAAYMARVPGWVIVPEVSFAFYADRGRVDILAWHPVSRSLLVIELKTEIVDVQETLGTLDMKRRLAKKIAAERGWYPASVSVWLVVAGSRHEPKTSGRSPHTARGRVPGRAASGASLAGRAGADGRRDEFLANR